MLPLNAEALSDCLDSSVLVRVFDEVDSTNAVLKRDFSALSTNQPCLVVADHQSAGYGKFRRSFFSPHDSGVYFSVLLPVDWVADAGLLTLGAGVCVCSCLNEMVPQRSFSLKWVNDVLVDNLKCGGILAESLSDDSGKLRAFVVGIGVNFDVNQFPNELAGIAGDAGVDSLDRNVFVASVIDRFLSLTQKTDSIIPAFRSLCSTFGKRVEVISGQEHVVGEAIDVDDAGALIVLDDKKNRHLFNSGEVSKIFV